jgi:predicted unusual protein kinase regulating ubiquinone biosynthesis (AarF/ABC1/UbiB family)
VPAEPAHVIAPIIEENLGRRIADIFVEFDPEPIAAASFGQAHLAILRATDPAPSSSLSAISSARRVIVKVQRPHLDAIVTTDIGALKTIVKWLKLYEPIRRRADLSALAEEFAGVIFEELDYEQEARNAETFARNFAADPAVRVPKTYLSSKRVLVLENVEEIKITDFEGLEDAGISRSQVAHKLFETYLQQIFVDGFFHADPHPGNLFVQPLDWDMAHKLGIRESANATSTVKTPTNGLGSLGLPQFRIPIVSDLIDELNRPNSPAPVATPAAKGRPFRLVYIDFGMVGSVTPANMQQLKEIIIATSLKDARRMTAAIREMGFFTPEADTVRIEQALGGLFDRMWGRSMTDLQNVDFDEMYSFAMQFRDLLSSLPFQIPQNVLYLGRATNILSGMCTALDPVFNPWTALQPFAQGMAALPANARANAPGAALLSGGSVQDVVKEALNLGRLGIQLPAQTEAVISRALNGQLEVRANLSPASMHELRRIEASVSRLTWAMVLIALMVCGTLLLINGITVGGVIALVMAVPALIRLLTL